MNKVNAFKNNPRLDVSQHDFGSHLQLVTLVDVSSSDELLSNGFALRLIAGEQYGSTTGNHMGRARVYLRKKWWTSLVLKTSYPHVHLRRRLPKSGPRVTFTRPSALDLCCIRSTIAWITLLCLSGEFLAGQVVSRCVLMYCERIWAQSRSLRSVSASDLTRNPRSMPLTIKRCRKKLLARGRLHLIKFRPLLKKFGCPWFTYNIITVSEVPQPPREPRIFLL